MTEDEALAARSRLMNVFQSEDPLNLIKMGAPSDEYTPEVTTVTFRFLTDKISREDCARILMEEFNFWLSPVRFSRHEDFCDLGNKVWDAFMGQTT